MPITRFGDPKIYIAVDTGDFATAQKLVTSLDAFCLGDAPQIGFKLGLEFFMANGVAGVEQLLGNRPLFLDLKFHDIPNTVAGAVRSVAHLKPNVLNVHATGGLAMMQAAKSALDESVAANFSKLIAVSVLTSMDESDLQAVGQGSVVTDQVKRLADLTKQAGLDGVVCSAVEAASVRDLCGEDFMRLTPGMRSTALDGDDQKRAMSPTAAFENGSSHLVIGRMITKAAEPAEAAKQLLAGL
ncbi:MAG: orotidine-5'-phosphate decarboxylase [Alphaproteobacteria bacterium]